MKVLIAEDNPIWRQMLKQNVSSWGYEPVVAEDGKEAWKILQRTDAPRLAVLDWQMPHMDGIDVCRHIKGSQTLPFTYVVMLTSRDAQIRFTCLARTIDHAAEYRDLQRALAILQFVLHFGHDPLQINLEPTTSGASDDFGLEHAAGGRLQDIETGSHFFALVFDQQ